MSWLPKRDKRDPVLASAIDLVVAQEGSGAECLTPRASFGLERVVFGVAE